jgi:hypothetical protein
MALLLFVNEVSLLFTIPVSFPAGTRGPRCLLELLSLAKQAVFRGRILLAFAGSLYWVEVTRIFATAETFCGGNSRPEICHCSAVELQQPSPLAGLEPATAGAM